MTNMTPKQALQFEHQSATNSKKIEDAVQAEMNCTCKAYVDIFTFQRWKAQGKRVPKGAIKVTIMLPKIVNTLAETPETPTFIPKTLNVWCRCQITAYEKLTTTAETV